MLSAPFGNGSFEQPTVPSGPTVFSDGASIGPWSVVIPPGNDVSLIHDLYEGLTPFDGSQFLNFNGGDLTPGGSVHQDFDTTAGVTYGVSFVAGRLGPAPGTIGVNATVFSDPAGSNTLANVDALALGSQGDWTPYSFQFTASGPTTRIRFSDISAATISVDVALDAVQVSAVPEPSLVTLAAVVVCSLLGYRRKRGS
jgi:hypothetical protein